MNFNLRLFGGRGGAFSQAAAGEVGHLLRGFGGGDYSLSNFAELKKEGAAMLRGIYDSKGAQARRDLLTNISDSAIDKMEAFAEHVVDSIRIRDPNIGNRYEQLRDMVGMKSWYMSSNDRANVQNLGELSRYVRTTTDKRAAPITDLFKNVEGRKPGFFGDRVNQADMYSHLANTVKSTSQGRYISLRQHNPDLAAELAGQLTLDLGSTAYPHAVRQASRRKK